MCPQRKWELSFGSTLYWWHLLLFRCPTYWQSLVNFPEWDHFKCGKWSRPPGELDWLMPYVVSMYVMSLVGGTTVAYALYSFFLILWNAHPHSVIANHIYIDWLYNTITHNCINLQKLPWKECTIQSSTSFMYDSCARESCQDQERFRHSVWKSLKKSDF